MSTVHEGEELGVDPGPAPHVAQSLGDVGEQRRINVAGITIAGRRRRPSGAPPHLPRELYATGRFWLMVAAATLVVWTSIFLWPSTTEWWIRRDHDILFRVVDLRNDFFTAIAEIFNWLGSEWAGRILRVGTLAVLVGYRRWRRFVVAVLVFLILDGIVTAVSYEIGRPRPFVEILADWVGPSHPSGPVALFSATLAVMGYALIPPGKWRLRWFVLGGFLVAAVGASRVYLGVDHLTDVLIGALFGVALAVLMFRYLSPDRLFPISYRRTRSAHLTIDDRRERALRRALQDRFGITVLDIEPFALEGSAGSTPLRVTVAGIDRHHYLFAKLYARNHLRSDRLYKLGRTVLYGGLEDEVRFNAVSRLVEYEDYMLRIMRDSGIPCAEPFGILEITPQREYVVVTEFIREARQVDHVAITDDVIDEALMIVRTLWDHQMAHRDIKPANVLIDRDGRVRLIDVAFATVRPTPWRQAVDLANMMLVLGLSADPNRVYARALRYFSADDIAEAFAATRGVTLPSQLRTAGRQKSRRDGVDLVEVFRRLAPPREPISIQRWSLRRVVLTAGVLAVIAFSAVIVVNNVAGRGFL